MSVTNLLPFGQFHHFIYAISGLDDSLQQLFTRPRFFFFLAGRVLQFSQCSVTVNGVSVSSSKDLYK